MTLAHGTNLENPEELKTAHLFLKGGVLQLLADFSIDSDRKISGVAHVPVIDRENELILADAVRKALPEYMKLPILHVQHTERPVGTVVKAYVDESGYLHILGEIKDTSDTDDVWADIRAGKLNKFSIFGKRIDASPECALAPNQRSSPCVTKALVLYSISVVGDNAMNEQTFLRVAKALEGGDHTPVGKYESMESCMSANSDKDSPGGYCASIEHRATGKWPAEKAMTEDEMMEKCAACDVEKCSSRKVEKSRDILEREPRNTSSIMDRLDKAEKAIADIYSMVNPANPVEKSEGEDKMDEKEKKDEKEEEVQKAAPEKETVKEEIVVASTPKPEYVTPDFITKAELDKGWVTKAELDTFQKAHDALKKAHDELLARVDKMEKETIEKGGNVVIIQKEDIADNPQLANLKAIGGV